MSDVARWDKPRDAAAEAVVWASIEEVAKERKEEAREFVAEHLRAESMRGVDAVAGGEVIGSVTRSKDRDVVDVVDDAAFLEYVIQHRKDALLVPYALKNALLKQITEVSGVWVDSEGVVVPGIGWKRINGSVRVNKNDDTREKVRELMRLEERLQELTEAGYGAKK